MRIFASDCAQKEEEKCHNQEDVDIPAGGVETYYTYEPDEKQYEGNCCKHVGAN